MQIKDSKKSRRSSNRMPLDSDFAQILERGRFGRLKTAAKIFTASIVTIGLVGGGAYALFIPKESTGTQSKSTTPESSKTTTQKDNISSEKEAGTPSEYESSDSNSTASGNSSSTSTSNQSTENSSSESYDPSVCDSYYSDYQKLKKAAEQSKATYDTAFAARLNYGDIYSQVRGEYGNDSSMYEAVANEADRRYAVQEAQLDELQEVWSDALDDQNAAYSEYQACRSKL